ncbi:GtrA family protein [Aureimonas glaciei]|uniref:Sugar transferase n=1 Tax=Aureimonas glaciei TaxID=1776957 RepID=A0A916XVA6_9HYPH|nr:GtrA family protein [Aureimonas glaciei]GGD14256.1 sugar transferase [Aureimonas glaciei]
MRQKDVARQLTRFLISGVLNTGTTYLIFLALLQFFSYRLAYSITYACGILIAYFLNSRFVFRKQYTVRLGLAVLVSYSIQYLYGLLALSILVDALDVPPSVAMLVVVLTAIPLQFAILRSVADTIPGKAR